MASPTPSKTPAQLAREANRARLERLRGTTMSKPVAPTAEQRKAANDRLMKLRGSDVPKPKPISRMKSGGMVKGKKK
jgi:hypothetical protein